MFWVFENISKYVQGIVRSNSNTMEMIKRTGRHCKEPAEEFGYNKLRQAWHKCIICRAQRFVFSKVVDKKPEVDEVSDHVWQCLGFRRLGV